MQPHEISSMNAPFHPGPIALFGSGETSPSGQKIFDHLFRSLPPSPRVTILETPAGFELNSAQVAGKVGDFLNHRLQNYDPRIEILPARRKGTPFSPDDPKIVNPMLSADLIFMGPGSPTYAVRQLTDSLAWEYLLASHQLGAGVGLASAATLAISAFTLPVYEIYKVGEDIHWKVGLNLFAMYGLRLVIIPHWNNNEGGNELDTSRCFIGQERFNQLTNSLPEDVVIVGIDEKTGLVIDLQSETGCVVGSGSITVLREGNEAKYIKHQEVPIIALGLFSWPEPGVGVTQETWLAALKAKSEESSVTDQPEEIRHLINEREIARQEKRWSDADHLRAQITELGWKVLDTPEGPKLEKLK